MIKLLAKVKAKPQYYNPENVVVTLTTHGVHQNNQHLASFTALVDKKLFESNYGILDTDQYVIIGLKCKWDETTPGISYKLTHVESAGCFKFSGKNEVKLLGKVSNIKVQDFTDPKTGLRTDSFVTLDLTTKEGDIYKCAYFTNDSPNWIDYKEGEYEIIGIPRNFYRYNQHGEKQVSPHKYGSRLYIQCCYFDELDDEIKEMNEIKEKTKTTIRKSNRRNTKPIISEPKSFTPPEALDTKEEPTEVTSKVSEQFVKEDKQDLTKTLNRFMKKDKPKPEAKEQPKEETKSEPIEEVKEQPKKTMPDFDDINMDGVYDLRHIKSEEDYKKWAETHKKPIGTGQPLDKNEDKDIQELIKIPDKPVFLARDEEGNIFETDTYTETKPIASEEEDGEIKEEPIEEPKPTTPKKRVKRTTKAKDIPLPPKVEEVPPTPIEEVKEEPKTIEDVVMPKEVEDRILNDPEFQEFAANYIEPAAPKAEPIKEVKEEPKPEPQSNSLDDFDKWLSRINEIERLPSLLAKRMAYLKLIQLIDDPMIKSLAMDAFKSCTVNND